MDKNKKFLSKLLSTFSKQESLDELLHLNDDRDGYKREEAVRRLGVLGSPIAIPKLIVRANDWVPQVRQAAKEALVKLMKNENAQTFVYCLPSIYHLQNCGRDNHEVLINEVKNFLLRPENVSHLQIAITSKENAVARRALKLCIENKLLEDYELFSKCLVHKDVVIRIHGSQLLRNLKGNDLSSGLAQAIRDPFMPIRREAFHIYIRVKPSEGQSIAKNLLFDKHVSVREIAVKHLKNTGFDVETFYSAVLHTKVSSALHLRCAVWGLAELGCSKSRADIENLTINDSPSVRKAALQALIKLIGGDAKPKIIEGLRDKSPSVVKESASLVKKHGISINIHELLEITKTSNHPHAYKACTVVARRINKWDRLIFLVSLLKLLKDQHEFDSEFINQELVEWDYAFNRSSSQPTERQSKWLSELYKFCSPLMDRERLRAISFTLKNSGVEV